MKTTALQQLIDRVRRQSAEGFAREAENSALIRTLPDMMFRLNKDGVYVDYHARNQSDLYVPPERFLGKKMEDIMPPDLAATFKASFVTAARSRKAVSVDYSLPMAEGERYFEARLVCLEGGEILSTVRDVTESRRAIEELHRNQAALEMSHRQVRELAGRLIVAQEAERRHLARELHDDVSQRMALLAAELDRLGHSATSKEMTRQFDHLSQLAAEIASGLHRLSYQLHPAMLEAMGLVAAIEGFCRELSSQSAITIEFSHRDVPTTVAPDVGLGLFRIVQEALHNVVKHSRANHTAVHLSGFGDRLELQIADAGVGFAVDRSQTAGLGLVSMRERMILLNGDLVIHSAPGAGTRIEVRVPIPSVRVETV